MKTFEEVRELARSQPWEKLFHRYQSAMRGEKFSDCETFDLSYACREELKERALKHINAEALAKMIILASGGDTPTNAHEDAAIKAILMAFDSRP